MKSPIEWDIVVFLCGIVLALIACLYAILKVVLWVWGYNPLLGIIVAAPTVIGIGYLLFLFLRTQFLAYWRGYSVKCGGHPDARDVVYREGDYHLRFIGEESRDNFSFTIVDEETWKEEMPDWAKNRRDEIVGRMVEEFSRSKSKSPRKVELEVANLSETENLSYSDEHYHKFLKRYMWPEKYKKVSSPND